MKDEKTWIWSSGSHSSILSTILLHIKGNAEETPGWSLATHCPPHWFMPTLSVFISVVPSNTRKYIGMSEVVSTKKITIGCDE